MDSGHNKDTIQGVHNVSGVTVTSYNPPTRHRWLHSSHTSDERWPSSVMSWPRKEFQWTTIVWRSDASLGQRQPTTFVCSVHCWGVLSLVCSCSFCLLSLMRRYWAVFVLHTPYTRPSEHLSGQPDTDTRQTLWYVPLHKLREPIWIFISIWQLNIATHSEYCFAQHQWASLCCCSLLFFCLHDAGLGIKSFMVSSGQKAKHLSGCEPGCCCLSALLLGHDGNKLNWFLHNKYSEGAQSTGGGIYNLFHHLPLQAAVAALHRQGPLFSSMYRCL